MKTLRNYKDFSENRLNENFLKKSWEKITKYFKKKYKELAWLYYAIFLKKNDKLPKEKVELFIPKSLKLEDIKVESLITEDVIDLEHPDPNIRNVDVPALRKKIRRVFDMNMKRVNDKKPRKKNHALFIWGAPGIGKTEILHQVAEENDAVVIEWHLSQIEPTDFRGIPKIENPGNTGDPKDERTVVKLPELFPDSDTQQPGIMFFDEMNRAPQMVLSAALSPWNGSSSTSRHRPSSSRPRSSSLRNSRPHSNRCCQRSSRSRSSRQYYIHCRSRSLPRNTPPCRRC